MTERLPPQVSDDALRTFTRAPEREFRELRDDVDPAGRPRERPACHSF
ncbi:hypothetical protein [Streptomyces sp. 2P-4]|nr:hypothetical protein [Streptomyces sp. 2P-4]